MKSFSRQFKLGLILFALAITQVMVAQTFRGGIAGTVQDSTGAVVSNAKISLTGTDTGYKRETVSTSSGDYSFQDLPLGAYSVEVTSAGFSTTKIDKVVVRPGQVFSLEIKLAVASSMERVEVNAAAISLDTQSTTNNAVVNEKAVENIPLNGRDFTQLLKIVPGYNGAGSLNGTRTNQNNYQIDGADNNDIWQNGTAANQGGVSGIAGVVLPIDAIDQFSVQSQGNAETGRNGGGLVSMVIKSGTNNLHGTAYYFNRNEFFAARSPFVTRKAKIRNNQFGFSLGGPIVKEKLFYFVTYERQKYVLGNQSAATEPTTAYVQKATALLKSHGFTPNPAMLNVLTLWPQGNQNSGPATTSNFLETIPQTGYSDNGVAKLDYNLTPRQALSVRAFIAAGRQVGNVGTNVYNYYQAAPDHVENYSIVHNWQVSDHMTNQALVGIGVFLQTFNDAVHNQNIPALGLNTGVTNPALYGAPTINMAGFDQIGVTPPLGRRDYTGHFTDTFTYVVGKHQFRFGGEFRRSYMDLLYQRNVRGLFNFTGTATNPTGGLALPTGTTPYYNDPVAVADPNTAALADYLVGYATSGSIVRGNLQRDIFENSFDLFAQDGYQVTSTLTLNYGLRYTYVAPFTAANGGTLSDFRPNDPSRDASGFVIVGKTLSSIYPPNKTNLAPRFGFAEQITPKFVVRGTYGIYFDVPNFNGFFDNRPGNGAAVGVQANKTGNDPVFTINRASTFNAFATSEVFPATGAAATYGAATVSPNFRTAYVENFNLNTEYQINNNTIFQLGYVGSLGRRLFNLRDINQPTPGLAATQQSRRPFAAIYPQLTAINQFESSAASNYNSLVTLIRTSGFHGLTAQAAYTYGHALDNVSGTRGFAPQDSYNLAAEYGNANFDVKHTFNGYIVYEVPKFTEHAKLLTQGWQGNSFLTFFTGVPLTIKTSANNSGTGELQDRVVLTGDPKAGINSVFTSDTSGKYVPLFNKASFALPAQGTYTGSMQRNALRVPGFATVDASLVKNTYIREGINLQLRAEMFNIFNRLNLAPPTTNYNSGSFGRATTTRADALGAPGIGSGEPFNVQFAGKIIF